MRQKEDTFKRKKEGSCRGKEETNDLFLKSFQGHVQAQHFRFFFDTQDIRGKTGGWSIGTQVMGLLENLFFFRVLRFSPSEKRNSFHSFSFLEEGTSVLGFTAVCYVQTQVEPSKKILHSSVFSRCKNPSQKSCLNRRMFPRRLSM